MHIMDQSTLMEPKCNITEHFHANSAFTRARTQTCKSQINELYCSSLERERSSDASILNKSLLKRRCSKGNLLSTNSLTNNPQARFGSKYFYGCIYHEHLIEYIENFDYMLHFSYNKSLNVFDISETINGEIETLQMCIDICVSTNKMVAFNQASKRCICLVALFDDFLGKLQSRQVCMEWYKTNENIDNLDEIHHTGFLGK